MQQKKDEMLGGISADTTNQQHCTPLPPTGTTTQPVAQCQVVSCVAETADRKENRKQKLEKNNNTPLQALRETEAFPDELLKQEDAVPRRNSNKAAYHQVKNSVQKRISQREPKCSFRTQVEHAASTGNSKICRMFPFKRAIDRELSWSRASLA